MRDSHDTDSNKWEEYDGWVPDYSKVPESEYLTPPSIKYFPSKYRRKNK